MRVLLLGVAMAVGGCASHGFSGTQQKNLELSRLERLGTMTYSDAPPAKACRLKQVRWCRDDGGSKRCRCVYIHEAAERLRRMAGEPRAY